MTLSISLSVLSLNPALSLDLYSPDLLDLLQEHLETPLMRELTVSLLRLVIQACPESAQEDSISLTVDPRGLWAEAASKGTRHSSEIIFQHLKWRVPQGEARSYFYNYNQKARIPLNEPAEIKVLPVWSPCAFQEA